MGLSAKAISKWKSCKFDAQPLSYEHCCHRLIDAARGNYLNRKRFGEALFQNEWLKRLMQNDGLANYRGQTMENIFEQALGVEQPWFIEGTSFDANNKRLDININFRMVQATGFQAGIWNQNGQRFRITVISIKRSVSTGFVLFTSE